ncbi:MAG: Structural constituent of ribosome [Paramarteilia canceri]
MDLIETGFIKQVDIPLWIDAYHSFPPLCEGYSDDSDKKRIKEVMVRNIVYNEDRLRIKFYKLYPKYKIVNLDSEKNSEFNEFLQIHSRLIDENYPEDDAFEMALKMAKIKFNTRENPEPVAKIIKE